MRVSSAVQSGFSTQGLIQRPALIKKIQVKAAKKYIFLSASGGYGKTIIARQWLSSARDTAAKLKLVAGGEDNDAGVFFKSLAWALLKLVGKEKTTPDTAFTLDIFLDAIAGLPAKHPRCYLVIDDLHMITNEDILNSLPLVAARLPGYIRLFVAGRSAPLESLLETGRFETLTQDDLLFSPEEVELLGLERNCELTAEQVQALLETTGGWALYLSALMSGDQPYKAAQTLKQYLESQVWRLWGEETRNLLLALAIPNEITPALCELLTEREGGRGILEHLTKKENAFLFSAGGDMYRFHDVFREFLLEHVSMLEKDEIRRLNNVAAEWYYERGDYWGGSRYYAYNRDHEGIDRCMEAVNIFKNQSDSMSVEVRMNAVKYYMTILKPEFIEQNPHLISKCAVAAYNDGDAEAFLGYFDMLYEQLSEIARRRPTLMHTLAFTFGVDHRVPFREYMKRLANGMSGMLRAIALGSSHAHVSTLTQNLPFFHRSMRDLSEYHELKEDDLNVIRATLGSAIGRDYEVIEQSLVSGIYYERGSLLDAARHALTGYSACETDMQPETVFCSYMITAAVLFSMGSHWDARQVMARTEAFVKEKARFLQANFNALQTKYATHEGDTEAAVKWLAVYGRHTDRMPFYQICRHFTTLRSYVAVGKFAAAAEFGIRLQTLAREYKRPLDQIESGLLTALALWHKEDSGNAVMEMERAVHIAAPYGFTQLFIDEGRKITQTHRAADVYRRVNQSNPRGKQIHSGERTTGASAAHATQNARMFKQRDVV